MSIDLAALDVRINEIIAEADLEQCSAKSVRKQLEAELEADLTPYKAIINEQINLAIIKRLKAQERESKKTSSVESLVEEYTQQTTVDGLRDEDLDDEELARQLQAEENSRARGRKSRATLSKVKGKRLVRKEQTVNSTKNPFNRPLLLSAPLSRLLGGATEMSRPQVVKHIWAYVKEHGLQDPADKRILVCDELMLAVMKKSRISCFAMNKILSDHLIKREESLESPPRKKSRRVKAERASDSDGDPISD